jgi:alpha-1,3-mannosyltransferase
MAFLCKTNVFSVDLNGEKFDGYYPYVRERSAQESLRRNEPFNVYSCWNGAAVLRGDVLLKYNIKFRALRNDVHKDTSCKRSECFLMCQDFRYFGVRHRVIAVIIVVSLIVVEERLCLSA